MSTMHGVCRLCVSPSNCRRSTGELTPRVSVEMVVVVIVVAVISGCKFLSVTC